MTKYYGSNTTLGVVKETEEGVIPANPIFHEVRYIDESLTDGYESTQSSLVTTSGCVADNLRTGQSPAGGFNVELTLNDATDLLFESALRGTWVDNTLVAGTGGTSFTVEKKITDGTTQHYFRYKGAKVSSISFSADSSNGIITGSVSVQARGTENSASIVTGATYQNAPLSPVFTFKDFTFEIFANGKEVCCSALSLEIATNLRTQKGRCTDDITPDTNAKGISYGQRAITGSISAYYSDGAQELYNLLTSDGYTTLKIVFSNGTQSYEFDMQKVKITDAPVASGGNSSDVQVNVSYQALLSDIGTDITITKK